MGCPSAIPSRSIRALWGRPMPTRALLAALAAAPLACAHGPTRPVGQGEVFALDALSIRAPPEPGWTAEEGGAGDLQWIRFRRPAQAPAEAREAAASQVPRAVRPGSPADLLEEVRQANREARARVDELHLELTEERTEPSERFGPLTVRFAGRGLLPRARRGAEAVLMREYAFVLPERPDRTYRVRYLEMAPEWSPGTGFEERAEAFFAGAIVRAPTDPAPGSGPLLGDQHLAAGPMAARLRGFAFVGAGAQVSGRALVPIRGVPGALGMELALDCFGGRSRDGNRGAFSISASALAVLSRGSLWAGGGLDLGYTALTWLHGGPQTDGILFGPHLAAGADLLRTSWGAFTLRLDLLAATPRYTRGGALLGMR